MCLIASEIHMIWSHKNILNKTTLLILFLGACVLDLRATSYIMLRLYTMGWNKNKRLKLTKSVSIHLEKINCCNPTLMSVDLQQIKCIIGINWIVITYSCFFKNLVLWSYSLRSLEVFINEFTQQLSIVVKFLKTGEVTIQRHEFQKLLYNVPSKILRSTWFPMRYGMDFEKYETNIWRVLGPQYQLHNFKLWICKMLSNFIITIG